MALLSRDARGRQLPPSSHEWFEIAVITGDAERIVARLIGQANEVVVSLAQCDYFAVGAVAKYADPGPAILGGR